MCQEECGPSTGFCWFLFFCCCLFGGVGACLFFIRFFCKLWSSSSLQKKIIVNDQKPILILTSQGDSLSKGTGRAWDLQRSPFLPLLSSPGRQANSSIFPLSDLGQRVSPPAQCGLLVPSI